MAITAVAASKVHPRHGIDIGQRIVSMAVTAVAASMPYSPRKGGGTNKA
jgi:hypothetical protein